MNKSVPFHMRLFNAAYRIPFLSFKAKERLAHSLIPAEKSKELKGLMHELRGGMNHQFGAYEALLEYAPNYARWNTDQALVPLTGGKLVASGAGMAVLDYWTFKEVDLFFAKYIKSAKDHEAFCRAVYRIAFSMKEWGYVTEDEKPKKLNDQEEAELRELVWGAMSLGLAEEMPELGWDASRWVSELKPLFYPDAHTY